MSNGERLFNPLGDDYGILAAREKAAIAKQLESLASEQEAREEERTLLWDAKSLEQSGRIDGAMGRFGGPDRHLARITGTGAAADSDRVSFAERVAQWQASDAAERDERAALLAGQLAAARRSEPPAVVPAKPKKKLSAESRKAALARILGRDRPAAKRSETPESYAASYSSCVDCNGQGAPSGCGRCGQYVRSEAPRDVASYRYGAAILKVGDQLTPAGRAHVAGPWPF
jgi:hypothetical protein